MIISERAQFSLYQRVKHQLLRMNVDGGTNKLPSSGKEVFYCYKKGGREAVITKGSSDHRKENITFMLLNGEPVMRDQLEFSVWIPNSGYKVRPLFPPITDPTRLLSPHPERHWDIAGAILNTRPALRLVSFGGEDGGPTFTIRGSYLVPPGPKKK